MGEAKYSSQSQPVRPKEQWARLYIDHSEDSSKAYELLHDAGYCILTFGPLNGTLGPVLLLGINEFTGLEEIMKAINANN
jgi:hypothetical protein